MHLLTDGRGAVLSDIKVALNCFAFPDRILLIKYEFINYLLTKILFVVIFGLFLSIFQAIFDSILFPVQLTVFVLCHQLILLSFADISTVGCFIEQKPIISMQRCEVSLYWFTEGLLLFIHNVCTQ